MKKEKLFPEHEELVKEAEENDKVLTRIVSSKAFKQMNTFLGGLGTMRTIHTINNLDLNNPRQLKLFIKYVKIRKRLVNNFKGSVQEYAKFEKECDKHGRR